MSQEHWQTVYTTKDTTKVSWYEPVPAYSIKMVEVALSESSLKGLARDKLKIIDVGGGDSLLSCELARLGYANPTAFDISAHSLHLGHERCAKESGQDVADKVTRICGDVTSFPFPEHAYHLWHDRAVFHFMTTNEMQQGYVANCSKALANGGIAVIGVFSKNGPKMCSGINVVQHDEESLRSLFSPANGFEMLRTELHVHTTPGGSKQEFIFAVLRRNMSKH